MTLPLAFLHGEQMLFGLVLAGLIALIAVPVLLYVWLWHTKWSEFQLAIGYLILAVILSFAFGAMPNDPRSIFSIMVSAFAFILTLPLNLVVNMVLSRFRGPGVSDAEFMVSMLIAAGLNSVLLYFAAVKMRRLIK